MALLASGALESDNVRVIKDIDYVEGEDYAEGKERLDLYLPEGARDFPVLVFYQSKKDMTTSTPSRLRTAIMGASGSRWLSATTRSTRCSRS